MNLFHLNETLNEHLFLKKKICIKLEQQDCYRLLF